MLKQLVTKAGPGAIPLTPVEKKGFRKWLAGQAAPLRTWVRSTGFDASPGSISLVAGRDGGLDRVLLGVDSGGADGEDIWAYAALPKRLPRRTYRIDAGLDGQAATRAALGWALGTYAFARYGRRRRGLARLVWPKTCDKASVERAALATFQVRDLINTPASDMGPEELSEAARDLARRHKARCTVITGDALIGKNYPAIHAVGRASARSPRLVDMSWGAAKAPKVTLIGKGVCFDSGGLDLKSASGMRLMKKDMGGAAHALGLAEMVMTAKVDVRLRVLIPAVENSVSGNALRPMDVIETRKGLRVEVGNTDAEGRLVLCDALAEADWERPELVIDFATLTGSARVALGTELPALFCNDDALAKDILRHGEAEADPLWRMPLWQPYRKKLDSKVADINSVSGGPYAGAITAALFLEEFVSPGTKWAHLDFHAWNEAARPGRPEGGEAMGMRALFALIRERFAGSRSAGGSEPPPRTTVDV